MNQQVLPAISNYKDLERFLKTDLVYCMVMNFSLAAIGPILKLLEENRRQAFVHIDLIKGIESNEYGVEFLTNYYPIYGMISTHAGVISSAKKKNICAVQRIFMIDSHSLDKSIELVKRVQPDYIELLPGYAYQIVHYIKDQISIPLIGGGLINNQELVNRCLEAGFSHITTSNSDLW